MFVAVAAKFPVVAVVKVRSWSKFQYFVATIVPSIRLGGPSLIAHQDQESELCFVALISDRMLRAVLCLQKPLAHAVAF